MFGLDKGVMPGILDQIQMSIRRSVDHHAGTRRAEGDVEVGVRPSPNRLAILRSCSAISEAATSLVKQVAPVIGILEDMRGMSGPLLDGCQTLDGAGILRARSVLFAALKAREAVLKGRNSERAQMIRTGGWKSNPGICCRSSAEHLRTRGCLSASAMTYMSVRAAASCPSRLATCRVWSVTVRSVTVF